MCFGSCGGDGGFDGRGSGNGCDSVCMCVCVCVRVCARVHVFVFVSVSLSLCLCQCDTQNIFILSTCHACEQTTETRDCASMKQIIFVFVEIICPLISFEWEP